MDKPTYRKIFNPSKTPTGYLLALEDWEGNRTSRTFPSRRAADAAKKVLEGERDAFLAAKRCGRSDIPRSDGSLAWYRSILDELTWQVAVMGDAEVRNNLKAVAAATKAVVDLHDPSEQERRIEELEAFVAEIRGQRKHGIRPQGTAGAIRAPAKSGEEIH